MKFSYRYRGEKGSSEEGVIDASTRDEVVSLLKERGITPLAIVEQKKKKGEINLPFMDKLLHGIKLKDKIVFARNLSGMLKAGLAMYRALTVLEKQAHKPLMKEVLGHLMQTIHGGGTLSSGMEKYPDVFSHLFVAMVRAGEESGALPRALDEVSLHLTKAYELKRKVKAAMIYPSVIVGVVVIIGILMFIFVVPTLVGMFESLETELPKSTQFIIWLSDTLSKYAILVFIGIGGLIFGAKYATKYKSVQRKIDWLTLRLPTIKDISRELNAARTARTISSLLTSGVSLVRAIEITEEVIQNSYFKDVLAESRESVTTGAPLSDTLRAHTNLYPIMLGEMVQVGEETGNLAEMLLDIAKYYEEEVENKTGNLSTIIEPALMVVIGGAVGFFAISMIQPMYSVLDGF